ncbi:MAG: 50S ribosomal protein L18 [bacterium]|nr:MAG: 50S ribosomal protein L18 [bacterium]
MIFEKRAARLKRKIRIRKKVQGTAERPRLNVFRSNRHLVVQAIDDIAGHTLVSVNTVVKDLKDKMKNNNMAAAREAGTVMAQRAKEKGIDSMVFDRNGYAYHGRIKQIAESLRGNGIHI